MIIITKDRLFSGLSVSNVAKAERTQLELIKWLLDQANISDYSFENTR